LLVTERLQHISTEKPAPNRHFLRFVGFPRLLRLRSANPVAVWMNMPIHSRTPHMKKKPPRDVSHHSLVTRDIDERLRALAEEESRTVSMMVALLLSEAMEARQSLSGDNA